MKTIELSDQQRSFVESSAASIVLRAGAGSGKTEVVVHRIARILADSPVETFRILALSYTVKAADQVGDRVRARLGSVKNRVEAETIHGFAHSLIRGHGSRIGLQAEPELLRRDEDRADLLLTWLRSTGRPVPDDARAELVRLDLDRARCRPNPLTGPWREALESANAVDYPAMLERATELLGDRWMTKYLRRVYRHIIVDEAQNLTRAQANFLRALLGGPQEKHIDFALVGDPRQSIVGFAGAESHLMMEIGKSYSAAELALDTNYRSARSIVDVAEHVAERLEGTPSPADLSIFPAQGMVQLESFPDEDGEGRAVALRIADLLAHGLDADILAPGESAAVRPQEIAVLGRTASGLAGTRAHLDRLGIASTSGSNDDDWLESTQGNVVVELIGVRAAPAHRYTRKRLVALLGAEGSSQGDLASMIQDSGLDGAADLAAMAECEDPRELVERLRITELHEFGWAQDRDAIVGAWDAFVDSTPVRERTFANFLRFIARVRLGNEESPGVRLLTIHRAQGREFKVVFVVACNDGQLPDFRAGKPEDKQAELRAFYVAITRAVRALYLTRAVSRKTRFGSRPTEASPFLRLVA